MSSHAESIRGALEAQGKVRVDRTWVTLYEQRSADSERCLELASKAMRGELNPSDHTPEEKADYWLARAQVHATLAAAAATLAAGKVTS